jgi:tetratricopeptide (TPR) repeat protein
MRKTILVVISGLTLVLASVLSSIHAQTPQESLDQYVADLQKNPEDYGLREKIVKFAQTMKPAPALPEAARRNYVMARTLFKDAKNIRDYTDAITKFRTAVLLAPWWADVYLDIGLACEATKQYAEAIDALRFYIAVNPDSEKSRKAQDEIYIIEAKTEKAAKKSDPAEIAKRQREAEEDFIKKLDGARYTAHWNEKDFSMDFTIDIIGRRVVTGTICKRGEGNFACKPAPGVWQQTDEASLDGRNFTLDRLKSVRAFDGKTSAAQKGTISLDGRFILIETCGSQNTYYRER